MDDTATAHQRTATQPPLVDALCAHRLLALGEPADEMRVSLLLPSWGGPHRAQEAVRRRNLTRAIGRALHHTGVCAAEVTEILRRLRDAAPGETGRKVPRHGLAVFASADWSIAWRVPDALPELAAVGLRCLVGPLVPMVGGEHRVVVLALTGEDVRLYEVTRTDLHDIPLEGLPLAPLASMPRQRATVQAFTADRGGTTGRAVFHGSGEPDAVSRAALLRYFRQVDAAMQQMFTGQRVALVLAGVRETQAAYREVSTFPMLLGEGVSGAVRDLARADIRERARRIAEPLLHRPATEAAGRFRALRGTGRTLEEPAAVAEAAEHGRVDVLLLSADPTCWRSVGERRTVHLDGPGGVPALLNRAAVGTLKAGGAVYAVRPDQMGGLGRVAAILRY